MVHDYIWLYYSRVFTTPRPCKLDSTISQAEYWGSHSEFNSIFLKLWFRACDARYLRILVACLCNKALIMIVAITWLMRMTISFGDPVTSACSISTRALLENTRHVVSTNWLSCAIWKRFLKIVFCSVSEPRLLSFFEKCPLECFPRPAALAHSHLRSFACLLAMTQYLQVEYRGHRLWNSEQTGAGKTQWVSGAG